ncbi:MAG: DUF4430 domain-containing protein [bacterium]|nr:DUF4430 domain-containing protein [bacterium]
MRTKFILSVLTIAVIAGIIFFNLPSSVRPLDLTPQETLTTTTASVSNSIPAQQKQPEHVQSAFTSTATSAPKIVPAPNVTLSVIGSSYTAFAPSGSTVLDAMKILASTNGFTFSGKDYPSLGFFVDSINGNRAENGYSWILYMNGKLSGTGASQTTLDAGDAIEWRYEKNY